MIVSGNNSVSKYRGEFSSRRNSNLFLVPHSTKPKRENKILLLCVCWKQPSSPFSISSGSDWLQDTVPLFPLLVVWDLAAFSWFLLVRSSRLHIHGTSSFILSHSAKLFAFYHSIEILPCPSIFNYHDLNHNLFRHGDVWTGIVAEKFVRKLSKGFHEDGSEGFTMGLFGCRNWQ